MRDIQEKIRLAGHALEYLPPYSPDLNSIEHKWVEAKAIRGCCPQNPGGAAWASSKPNLLNVAITRAKKIFFIIGDPEVWQDKPHFSDVAKKSSLFKIARLSSLRAFSMCMFNVVGSPFA